MTGIIAAKLFILMVLFHVLDDFVLQAVCLSNLKQREWWMNSEEGRKEMYKNDYVAALTVHGFSWSAMILVPSIILGIDVPPDVLIALFFVNALVHAIVDDLKANEKIINLVTDQVVHIGQVVITWCIICIVV